jgi:DNA-binding transcriptional ArsR family regulator
MRSAAPLDREQIEAVARLFRVLSEPTRLEILQTLRKRPCSVNDLVEKLGAKQANVSKQLGILHDAGLLARERLGSEVHYSIREPMIFDLCDLVCGKLQRDAQRLAASFAGTTVNRKQRG